MTEQPRAESTGKTRSRPVKPGRLAVSEFAADRQGAGSPFGDDLTFPLAPETLTYDHPDSRH